MRYVKAFALVSMQFAIVFIVIAFFLSLLLFADFHLRYTFPVILFGYFVVRVFVEAELTPSQGEG